MSTIITIEKIYKTKLQEIREQNGLTRLELAKQTGLTLDTIEVLENQRRDIKNSKLGNVLKICEVLNCSIYDLID